jgi:hypothetical protein
MRKRLIQVLLPLVGVGFFLLGLSILGQLLRDRLREDARYTITFGEIDCNPPPGQERADFLDEVQYLGDMPERLRLLDEDLGSRLAAAFARHPWVERVEEVRVQPPRQVEVRLVHRRPVLAVVQQGQTRVVDRHGILLPRSAPAAGLPVFTGRSKPPAGPAGTAWGDAEVEAAAGQAAQRRIP